MSGAISASEVYKTGTVDELQRFINLRKLGESPYGDGLFLAIMAYDDYKSRPNVTDIIYSYLANEATADRVFVSYLQSDGTYGERELVSTLLRLSKIPGLVTSDIVINKIELSDNRHFVDLYVAVGTKSSM